MIFFKPPFANDGNIGNSRGESSYQVDLHYACYVNNCCNVCMPASCSIMFFNLYYCFLYKAKDHCPILQVAEYINQPLIECVLEAGLSHTDSDSITTCNARMPFGPTVMRTSFNLYRLSRKMQAMRNLETEKS